MSAERLLAFADELTALCRKHGVTMWTDDVVHIEHNPDNLDLNGRYRVGYIRPAKGDQPPSRPYLHWS